jgi:hypothetical protein
VELAVEEEGVGGYLDIDGVRGCSDADAFAGVRAASYSRLNA